MRSWTAVLVGAALPFVAQRASAQDSLSGPAIVLRAAVSAREVRFNSTPTIRVVLKNGVVDSVRVLERRNLPEAVQPGVTYRDVYVAVEILGHLDAQCLSDRLTHAAVPRCAASDSTKRSP